MNEFLAFRKFITPVIIQIVFWIGVVLMVGFAITTMVLSEGNAGGIITGFILLFLGPLAVRVYCELLILMFRIHDALSDIRNYNAYQYYYQSQRYPQQYQQQYPQTYPQPGSQYGPPGGTPGATPGQ